MDTGMTETVTVGTGENAQQVSLSDIAGVDISAVAPNYGFTPTPAGTWHFRCAEATLAPKEYTPKGSAEKVTAPCVTFRFEAVNVLALTDPALSPADYVGWEHQEMVFIKDPRQDIGKCRAIMEGAGLVMQGSFGDSLNAFVGMEFQAVVTNTKDKNDTSKVWANMDLKKIQPAGGGTVVAQVAATGSVAPPPPAPAQPTQPVNPVPPAQPVQPAAPASGGFTLNT